MLEQQHSPSFSQTLMEGEPFIVPMSCAQQRLWILDQIQPGTATYSVPTATRLEGGLDVAALQKSFDYLVRRHEILRTYFAVVDNEPVQLIRQSLTLKIRLLDLRNVPKSERDARSRHLVENQIGRFFDLGKAPLMRVMLVRLSDTEHILVLNMHHIITDGWSTSVLNRELGHVYDAYRRGDDPCLGELPIQYADFAVWQREQLNGEVLARELDYWKQRLAGAPLLVDLPTDRPRWTMSSSIGAQESVLLSSSLTFGLRSLSHDRRTTLFITLLAALKVLLYRYSGQTDLVVGSAIANRTRAEVEGLIGFFVNTLALRTNVDPEASFIDLLHVVHRQTLEAYERQDLPFEKIVEKLHPERRLGLTPFINVFFVLEDSVQALKLCGLISKRVYVDPETSKFELTLQMTETENGLRCGFQYSTEVFDRARIVRMLGHFQRLLQGVVDSPELPISRLPLMSDAETHQLLVEWNDTSSAYPADTCLHQLFEAQAERTPDAIALVFRHAQLTYRELNERANRLAHYLRGVGVKTDVLVAVCIDRSIDMIVAILAILKAGGAYVPLDPDYPRQRLAFMLEDTRASVVLTRRTLLARLPEHQTMMFCLDEEWHRLDACSAVNPPHDTSSQALAYVMYTSGSTGRPKGVMIEHRSAVNYVHCMSRAYRIGGRDVVLQFMSLAFDVSVEEIFVALSTGATLVMRTPEMIGSAACFLDSCQNWNISILVIPTAYWHELTALMEMEGLRLPRSVRLVRIGGESFSGESVRKWRDCVSGAVKLVSGYGPTEATINCAVYEISPGTDVGMGHTVPIGRPLANTQAFILDRNLQTVPIGVAGELHVGGVGLARAYLRRPELTAEKFISHPFNKNPLERLYKTGDLARYRADGTIEFLGRSDRQLKIRGFRIEPGEIEATLRLHPRVQDSAVKAVHFPHDTYELVAYIVAERESSLGPSDLRSFLTGHLPAYMVPSRFAFLNALPLNLNGKVDYSALPSDIGQTQTQAACELPNTYTQKTLSTIWAELLGRQHVGLHDDFFELGGHSLLAMRVIARIRAAFEAEIPVSALFERPTIAALSQYLDS